jgi:ubiquinone/menaquinone biosynthesis C-methylase UbiE
MLDIASGPGTLMLCFHKAFPNLKITCTDMNPVALGYLRSNTGFRVLDLKLPGLEGLDEQFDIISCFDTWYLLNAEDMKTAMGNVYRLMQDRGAVFIVDFDLSRQMDPAKFIEIARYSFSTDKLSTKLFFLVEQKMRDKYNVLSNTAREQLIRFGVLPLGYKPRLKYLFWVIYYLLYPARMVNKFLYSSVLINRLFSIFGKDKYTFYIYTKP